MEKKGRICWLSRLGRAPKTKPTFQAPSVNFHAPSSPDRIMPPRISAVLRLPPELWLCVTDHLNYAEIVLTRLTCKSLYSTIPPHRNPPTHDEMMLVLQNFPPTGTCQVDGRPYYLCNKCTMWHSRQHLQIWPFPYRYGRSSRDTALQEAALAPTPSLVVCVRFGMTKMGWKLGENVGESHILCKQCRKLHLRPDHTCHLPARYDIPHESSWNWVRSPDRLQPSPLDNDLGHYICSACQGPLKCLPESIKLCHCGYSEGVDERGSRAVRRGCELRRGLLLRAQRFEPHGKRPVWITARDPPRILLPHDEDCKHTGPIYADNTWFAINYHRKQKLMAWFHFLDSSNDVGWDDKEYEHSEKRYNDRQNLCMPTEY